METHENEFEDALEHARSLLAANECSDELWDANELVNVALRLRPDDVDAWILKSQILSALEDNIAALAAVEMAVCRCSRSADAHYWRAAILTDLQRYDEALVAVKRAFQLLGPNDDCLIENLYYERATILNALGYRCQAVATLKEGLRRYPDSSLLRAGLEPIEREQIRSMFKVIPGGLS